jgi:TonB family protein
VFMALDLVTEKAGRLISLHEVGELEPYTPRPVSIKVHLAVPIGSWHYVLHLYTGGEEILQSEIPTEAREQALDRMVATRIKGLHSESPKPFVTPPPEYPSSLKAANLSGNAVISLRIGANGAVYSPVVKSASDPAFGQAALAAVSVWRFLPKVSGGHAVETVADMPFAFSPAGKR